MVVAKCDTVAQKFIVESFDNHDPADDRRCRRHFEFDTPDAALACARRIMDKSLRRTHGRYRTSNEWYRHWSEYGDSVTAPGTGFDPRNYAKVRIREIPATQGVLTKHYFCGGNVP